MTNRVERPSSVILHKVTTMTQNRFEAVEYNMLKEHLESRGSVETPENDPGEKGLEHNVPSTDSHSRATKPSTASEDSVVLDRVINMTQNRIPVEFLKVQEHFNSKESGESVEVDRSGNLKPSEVRNFLDSQQHKPDNPGHTR